MPIKKNFLPRDNAFWLFHGMGWFTVLAMNMALRIYAKDAIILNFSVSIFLIFICSLSSFVFRRLYYKYGLFKWNIGKVIPIVITWVIFSSILISLLLAYFTLLLTPILGDLHSQEKIGILTTQDIVAAALLGYALPISFIQSIWTFIYIMVVTYRRVQFAAIDNLRLENTLKDAQLSTLTNQLNPHFLFNSLNNLRFMVYQDTKKSEEMITSLSEILRYSLDVSRREKVSIQEEIDIVRQYIALIEIQAGPRLKFSMHIEESIMNFSIPPMMLQMLVENAVKHGIDQCPKGGQLDVKGIEGKDKVTFIVKNDTTINPINTSSRASPGIGIKNIKKRLALLYSCDASLILQKEKNKFIASLIIPKEE